MSFSNPQPLIFGEVLFDEFSDGSKVLGGAPFNVAWHLQGFGQQPLFISRIGQDENGDQILGLMQQWGMNTEAVQRDPDNGTGRVTIKLVDAQPEFNILYPAAYDFIDINEYPSPSTTSNSAPILYHGSLAARAETSAQSLQKLKAGNVTTFVDVNLRAPWWNHEQVDQLLQNVEYVKLNDDELQLLSTQKYGSLREQAEAFRKQYQIRLLIITRGSDGAWLLTDNAFFESEPVAVTNMVDTVGAGDAFSSVCILGILQQWPVEHWLQRAGMFASAVCQQQGATIHQPSIYTNFLQSWQL